MAYAKYIYNSKFDSKPVIPKLLNGPDLAQEMKDLVKEVRDTKLILNLAEEKERKRARGKWVSGEDSEGDDRGGEKNEKEKKKNDSKEKEGEDNEESDEEDSDEEQKQEEWEVEKNVDSHHLDRRCVVPKSSGYSGPNLKRHLTNVHIKKGHIKADDVDRLFSLGQDRSKKRGPKRRNSKGKAIKGRPKPWCPEPDCEYLGPCLPEHLQNQHRMKTTGATYKLALKVASRFKGLKAELENIVELGPAIQEIRVPSPPFSPSPKSTPSKLRKRPRESNESSDEDVVPPTPAKKPVRAVRPAPPAAPAPPVALPQPPTGVPPAKQPLPAASPSQEGMDDDSEDDDESVYPQVEDYFKDPDPKTNRHKWLINFYRHFYTPSSGFHKDKNRL